MFMYRKGLHAPQFPMNEVVNCNGGAHHLASAQFLSVERVHGILGIFFIRETDKSETFGFPRLTVCGGWTCAGSAENKSNRLWRTDTLY